MINDLPISIREINSNDYPFILKTWSNEYHKVPPTNFIPNSIFFPHQKEIINKILEISNVLVCHLDEENDNIVGYLIFKKYDNQNIILHWAHVKSIYRRQGVAKEMLNFIENKNKNLICSHYFTLFKKLKDNYNLIYDPSLLKGLQ